MRIWLVGRSIAACTRWMMPLTENISSGSAST